MQHNWNRLFSWNLPGSAKWIKFNDDILLTNHNAEIISGTSVTGDARVGSNLTLLSAELENGTIGVWDAATGDTLLSLNVSQEASPIRQQESCYGHLDTIRACAFTTDGSVMLTASKDTSLKVWKVNTAHWRASLEGHTQDVLCCDLTPDATFAASGSIDGTVRLWDVTSRSCVRTIYAHEQAVHAVRISSNGSTLVSASADGNVCIWDANLDGCKMRLTGHTDTVSCLALARNGSFLASGSYDASLKIWNLDLFQCTSTSLLQYPVTCCAANSSWSSLIVGCRDGSVAIFKVDTEGKAELLSTCTEHGGRVISCAAGQGDMAVTCAADKSVLVWGLAHGTLCSRLNVTDSMQSSFWVGMGAEASLTALAMRDDLTLTPFSLRTEALRYQNHLSSVNCSCASAEAGVLVTGSADRAVMVWPLSLDGSGGSSQTEARTLLAGHTQEVVACALGVVGDGTFMLATCGREGELYVWDSLDAQRPGCQVSSKTDWAGAACVMHGTKIFVASRLQGVRIWSYDGWPRVLEEIKDVPALPNLDYVPLYTIASCVANGSQDALEVLTQLNSVCSTIVESQRQASKSQSLQSGIIEAQILMRAPFAALLGMSHGEILLSSKGKGSKAAMPHPPALAAVYPGVNHVRTWDRPLVSAGSDGSVCLWDPHLARGQNDAWLCAYKGDLEGLRNNLWKSSGEDNPLAAAVAAGQTEIIQELLSGGEYLEAPPTAGMSPLHIACILGSVSSAEMLLRAGAMVDARIKVGAAEEETGPTPLMLALQARADDVRDLLLKWDAELEVVERADENFENTLFPMHKYRDAVRAIDIDDYKEASGILTEQSWLISLSPIPCKYGLLHALARKTGNKEAANLLQTQLVQQELDTNVRDRNGQTPLMHAAATGNVDAAKLLLQGAADASLVAMDGSTALSQALNVEGSDASLEMITLLIKASEEGCEMKGPESEPLINMVLKLETCSADLKDKLVDLLTSAKASPLDTGALGRNALHWAVDKGLLDIAAKIYASHPDAVLVSDNDGFTPLQIAINQGQWKLALSFLPTGPMVNKSTDDSGNTLLHRLVVPSSSTQTSEGGQETMPDIVSFVEDLLKRGANPLAKNDAGRIPLAGAQDERVRTELLAPPPVLVFAAGTGDLDKLRKQLDSDDKALASVDCLERTALHAAVLSGNDEACKILLAKCKLLEEIDSKDRYGFTPLALALLLQQDAIRDLLLSAGAEISQVCDAEKLYPELFQADKLATRLLSMAVNGSLSKAVEQAVRGLDPSVLGKVSRLLHIVVEKQEYALLADVLAITGINLEARLDGETPFLVAARLGDSEALQLLANAGADTQACDMAGNTALHLAVQSGKSTAWQFLLYLGARADLANQEQCTPLHLAAELPPARQDALQELAEALSDTALALDMYERTALDIAVETDNVDMIRAILSALTDTVRVEVCCRSSSSQDPPRLCPLSVAVRASTGNWEQLVRAFTDVPGSHLNAPFGPKGRTLLHEILAVRRKEGGIASVVRAALVGGSDALACDGEGKMVTQCIGKVPEREELLRMLQGSVLWAAVKQGDMGTVKDLSSEACDLNWPGPGGVTPVLQAALDGNVSLALQLVACGADVMATDLDGRSALSEMPKLADPDNVAQALVSIVDSGGSIEAAKSLLMLAPAAVNSRLGHETLIHKTAKKEGAEDFLRLFTKVKVADLDGRAAGNTPPILAAIKAGNIKAATLLAELPGTRLNSTDLNGDSILLTAVRAAANSNTNRARYEELVDKILQSASDRDADQEGKKGSSILSEILSKTDSLGATPLHAASSLGLLAVTNNLLAFGASVDVTDAQGNTPVHLAAMSGSADVMRALLGKSSDSFARRKKDDKRTATQAPEKQFVEDFLFLRNSQKRSAVLLAKDARNWKCLEVMASYMDRTDTEDRPLNKPLDAQGNTLLHLAAQNGLPALVKELISAGADRSKENDLGWTPLMMASSKEIASSLGGTVPIKQRAPSAKNSNAGAREQPSRTILPIPANTSRKYVQSVASSIVSTRSGLQPNSQSFKSLKGSVPAPAKSQSDDGQSLRSVLSLPANRSKKSALNAASSIAVPSIQDDIQSFKSAKSNAPASDIQEDERGRLSSTLSSKKGSEQHYANGDMQSYRDKDNVAARSDSATSSRRESQRSSRLKDPQSFISRSGNSVILFNENADNINLSPPQGAASSNEYESDFM